MYINDYDIITYNILIFLGISSKKAAIGIR
jgi:hypothetical protein